MRRYQSLEKIKEADVEDLMQTETMNEKAAQAVYAFFPLCHVDFGANLWYTKKQIYIKGDRE